MADKSLVIDVQPGRIPFGSKLNSWTVLNDSGAFIRNIITPELTKKANIGALVSGIPTAFARVDLFNSAISAGIAKSSMEESGNLAGFYSELVSEWRGFIACIGLDYPNIKVRRVELTYSDGKPIEETSNIYEPAGAFGNMLLERKKRWCDPMTADNEIAVPYLNIIKYLNNVVGATAPETLVFTSSGYKIENTDEKPWVDIHTGKFIDPLKSDLSETELKTLYAYVGHILKKLPDVESKIGIHLAAVRENLERWQKEMDAYAASRHFGVKGGAVPPVDAGFTGPFADLFNYEDRLYVKGDAIKESPFEGAEGFDPKKLLLPPTAKITRIHLTPEYSKDPSKVKDLPILLLTASEKGNPNEKAFFALPLSAQGLNVYSSMIESLVNSSEGTSQSKLMAVYDPDKDEDNLDVELSIQTENGTRRYCQCYTVGNDPRMLNKDILVWPNFISKQWNQYYLYSELPHNTANQCTAAYPFVGNPDDKNFRIITDDEMKPILLAENGEIVAPGEIVNAKLLITSGISVANNPYKYEIYRSDKPFKGIRLQAPSGEEGGYLLINYQKNRKPNMPVDLLQDTKLLKEITVGIDFGSTNTSVAYSDQDGTPQPFEFTNQRISLFGQHRGGAKAGLQENRVLFFQAPEKPLKSNALHSILTIHDELRLGKRDDGETTISQIGKEVVGGFPCFMDNLPVENVSEEYINLKFAKIGQVDQIHNMKWSNDPKDIARKKAYLRTLMLHIYAQMFLKDYRVPVQLRWSYPSAMNNQLLNKYKLIWEELSDLKPVRNEKGMTVPLKVSTCQSMLDLASEAAKQPKKRRTLGEPAPSATQQADAPGYAPQTPVGAQAAPDMGTMQQMQQLMQMQQQSQQMYMQMLSQPMPPEMMMQIQQQMQQQMQYFQNQINMLMQAPQPAQTHPLQQPVQQPVGFQKPVKPQEMNLQEAAASDKPRGFIRRPTANSEGTDNKEKSGRPDLRPDDPDRIVSYEPIKLFSGSSSSGADQTGGSNMSLTEANAVANFLSETHGDSRDQLNICFDIGGSTTDITALYKLNEGITMVKQNSIRFAAQRVSRAVKYEKNFEKVLLEVCRKFNLSILGLNQGASRYTPETASYYFDQIVDCLTDQQLPALYNLIVAECPHLMWVNMYVTGLLMYYAGQISAKLIEDLTRLDPKEALAGERLFPLIRISFAGKGSRLYQWLSMTHPDAAKKYYDELFIQGYGDEEELDGMFEINLPTFEESSTIKYEVSMGLAKNSTELCNPRYNTPSEIIGESGFSIVMADDTVKELPDTNSISPEMIEHIGTFFFPTGPNQTQKFKEFCRIFDTATQQLFNIRLPKDFFESGTRNMNITQYVQTTPEFMRAKREKSQNKDKFDFVAPIIILEGMKFYDDHLLKPLKWASQES